MSASSRAGTSTDAIQGVVPRVVYEPATVAQAAQLVGASARAGETLAFVGGATDLELGAPPSRLDAVVRTGRMARVLEYAPSDQIVAVEAGMTLEALQGTLAANRQRLALDPPLPARATVGGIVAANTFGPRRARFGSVRDLIIGVSFVRADGTVARAGGKVVKNVAGFDLPKLMVGSLGTLGLIAAATFRLHPMPEEESTLLLPGRSARGVRDLVALLREAQLETASVVASWREGNVFDVAVRFEGFAAGVAEQRERAIGIARGQTPSTCLVLDGSAKADFWAEHDRVRTEPPLRAKLACLPADVEKIAAAVLPSLASAFDGPGFAWYATLGFGFFGGQPREASQASAALGAARQALLESGGTLVLTAAPREIRERMDVWGPPPPAIGLMRSVKERLDPDRRLAPGRFVGGI